MTLDRLTAIRCGSLLQSERQAGSFEALAALRRAGPPQVTLRPPYCRSALVWGTVGRVLVWKGWGGEWEGEAVADRVCWFSPIVGSEGV